MKNLFYLGLIALAVTLSGCDKKTSTPDTGTDIICNCDYQHMKYVKGSKYLWAPNAFTPNHDGLNDLFEVMSNEMDSLNYALYIFNPSQKLIFSTFDMSKKWEGPSTYISGNYPVILRYTDADGSLIEKRFCIYILPFDSVNNCFKTGPSADLNFPDQFDPITVSAKYTTNEDLCP